MTNAGRRAIEKELNQTKREILFSIQTFDLSDNLVTALFLGAARKHHFKRFPSVAQVDTLIDQIHDSEDSVEVMRDLNATVMACYLSVDKSVVYDAYYSTDDGDEAEYDGESEEAPKARSPRRTTKKD